ncbi:hypothetical protein [Fulvimonas yonginensis]|uniref:Uncharacterized protein n=1 Tax=Fulvimonas yonginensis TaxID=1495200 RepID=A0ABU8J9B2_9GAMM
MAEPTPEGLRRYPHTQGYFPDRAQIEAAPDRELPCTCVEGCPPRCTGECGCKACEQAFAEFCDVAGFYGQGDFDHEAALQAYREVHTDDRLPGGTGA